MAEPGEPVEQQMRGHARSGRHRQWRPRATVELHGYAGAAVRAHLHRERVLPAGEPAQ